MLEESANSAEEDSLLKMFIDLGENCPKFLRPQLEQVIKLALQVDEETVVVQLSWLQLKCCVVYCNCF